MKTTIDKAGRVVIPAAVRSRQRFSAGTELEIVEDDLGVRLVRKVDGPRVVRVGKRLVARPSVRARDLPSIDIPAIVDQERNRWPW